MAFRLSILVFSSLILPFQGNAHAILTSSQPAGKQVLKGPDIDVSLTFNARIDAKRSRLILVAMQGTAETPLSITGQPAPGTLTAQAKGLRQGSYILRWQVLAKDGHITRGEIPFNVQ